MELYLLKVYSNYLYHTLHKGYSSTSEEELITKELGLNVYSKIDDVMQMWCKMQKQKKLTICIKDY